jgi:glyoxylase-like metal-dependent hydrolase (beta-lactamase superfamily II)
MPLEDDFSDILKKARMGQGLSVADVAEATGLAPEDIAALERGRQPTASQIQAVASALGLSSAALKQNALDGWMPDPPPSWVEDGARGVHTVLGDIGGYEVKGYVLYDSGVQEAILIDTGYNPEAMLGYLDQQKLRLTAVGLTHGHADHAGGLDRILQRWRVPVYLGEGDRGLLPWTPPGGLLRAPSEGETITLGQLAIRCLITPGHTPGGICYRVELPEPYRRNGICFVGDTLFAGSIGRANPFSLYPKHLESVRTRVLTLPEDTVLFPGHGPATTVREEWAHNPFAPSHTQRAVRRAGGQSNG